ncbi:hypothetical protein H7H69_22605 [Mycobacterium heckeshornense]|nr:hypothetical protein [Mycobacterium heckeshornense]
MLWPLSRSSRAVKCADAVVTGAGSGIGRSFAIELAFARRGGRVVCADIDPVRAEGNCCTCRRTGWSCP